MNPKDNEYQKNLDSEEAIDAYLKGAMKLHDESYIRHCQDTADKARATLFAAREGK